MMLPGVFDEEDVKQQIGVVTHIVPISKSAVPKQLGQQRLRELGIFPAAILQKFESIFADIRVFDEFFDVAKETNCQWIINF